MATTTPGAIRDAIIARIAGLTPAAPATPAFIAHRDEQVGLIEWSGKNPTACLRRFDVERAGGPRGVEIATGTEEHVRFDLRIVVAYPATQRFVNGRGLADVMDADLALILRYAGTLGFSVTPTSNATIVDDGWDFDRSVPGVVFAIAPLNDIAFWRSVA